MFSKLFGKSANPAAPRFKVGDIVFVSTARPMGPYCCFGRIEDVITNKPSYFGSPYNYNVEVYAENQEVMGATGVCNYVDYDPQTGKATRLRTHVEVTSASEYTVEPYRHEMHAHAFVPITSGLASSASKWLHNLGVMLSGQRL